MATAAPRMGLRLDRRRLRLRRQRLGTAPGGEGLPRGRHRVRPALPRRGLREEHLEPAALPLGPGAGPARNPAHDHLQGHLHGERRGRGRRQPRVRQHALSRQARVLRQPAVAARREDWSQALAPHYDTAERMLGACTGALRQRRPEAAARDGRRIRRARLLRAHPVRRLLRRARRDGCRPLLRRRGAGANRLHALRGLHGRLPRRRQEHPGEELPLVRREARAWRSCRTAR